MITDRTQADVDYAKVHKGEDLKGSYNSTDWNRVEAKVDELQNLLKDYSYFDASLIVKTDWARTDDFKPETAQRYLHNIQTLKDNFYVTETTPPVPNNMNKGYFNYEKANDIEKILNEIERLINNMVSQFYYCGEIFSGEVNNE